MKNKSLIITVIALIAVLAAALIIYPVLSEKTTDAAKTTEEKPEATASPSEQAVEGDYKDITVYDKNGNVVMLSDFIGKPVILNFWATWCGYCIQEMPDFEAAYKEYSDEIEFLIINTDDGISKGEEFIAENGYTFPTYYDLEYNAAITYGISGIPRTVAIDKNGNIQYDRAGKLSAEALQDIIDMIK